MTTTQITRTEQADTITYALVIDGEQVSYLAVTAEHRVVENVETASGHERRGYARMLWEHANAEAEVLHAQEHHRTAEGDAFAQAMGGESADEATDYIDVCCICTGDDH